eukprot:SAG22_NODE_10067_length_555_cov_0.692982_1_plen_26_part_01
MLLGLALGLALAAQPATAAANDKSPA